MAYKATAILPSWRRIPNLPQIVGSLLGVARQVIVWHNDQQRPLVHADVLPVGCFTDRVLVVNHPENVCTFGRFEAMNLAKYDLILTQDDDYLVHNWDQIYDAWKRNPRQITTAIPNQPLGCSHFDLHSTELLWPDCHEVLLGWGSAFDRRLARAAVERYQAVWGTDQVLYRKCDRIVSWGGHHQMIPADFTAMADERRKGVALYLRDDHTDLNTVARGRSRQIVRESHVQEETEARSGRDEP
jgi:hypothetical protein